MNHINDNLERKMDFRFSYKIKGFLNVSINSNTLGRFPNNIEKHF